MPSKAIPSEGKTNCNDQTLQNSLVIWINVQYLEDPSSVLLNIPLFYCKTHFFLNLLFMFVKQKGQISAGISQVSSLPKYERSKATIWKIFRRNKTSKQNKRILEKYYA